MITKSPTKKNKFRKNILFTASARVAFSYILKTIKFNVNESILIPSYIGYTDREGSGVFDPILENKLNYIFYPLGEDLIVDISDLQNIVKLKNVKALLIIHYFGFCCCDIKQIVAFCKENKILLIEDCAHTLYSECKGAYLGRFGDFSFNSLHKVIPTCAGGLLRINNSRFCLDNIVLSDNEQINIEDLILYSTYDSSSAIEVIRNNYGFLKNELEKIEGVEFLMLDFSDGIVPMNLPVCINKQSRETFYFKMIAEGIVLTSLYYRLIDAISEDVFPTSHRLSKTIINYPINQDVTKEEMVNMAMLTNKLLNNES